jgi:hypothetical protein
MAMRRRAASTSRHWSRYVKRIERNGQIFDSEFEADVICLLDALGVRYRRGGGKGDRKADLIPFVEHRKYKPDVVLPNGIIIEVKGYWLPEDRTKHLLIREANPALDVRFVFQNPNSRLRKGSQTTYAMWCDQHGFKHAARAIPPEWLKEKSCT